MTLDECRERQMLLYNSVKKILNENNEQLITYVVYSQHS